MHLIEARFIGGPVDGQTRWIGGAENELRVEYLPSLESEKLHSSSASGEKIKTRTAVYVRDEKRPAMYHFARIE